MPWKRQAARIVRPAELRSASTSPVRTCSRGRSSTARRSICSSAPTRRRCSVAADAGAIAPDSRVDLLAQSPGGGRSQRALAAIETIQELLEPSFRRIAVGDPAGGAGRRLRQAVPAEPSDLWTVLESRIVPVANVRAALTAVETGSADAAIVYRIRRAIARGDARLAFVVSGRPARRASSTRRPSSRRPGGEARRSGSWPSCADRPQRRSSRDTGSSRCADPPR